MCRRNTQFPISAPGFSIVELMVAVAVGAILLALAIPSFRGTIVSNNVTETTNQLIADLNLARSEAVRRGTLVAVIATDGTNWSNGWYVESDGDFLGTGAFSGNPVAVGSKDVLLRQSRGVDTGANYKVTTAVTTVVCATAKTTPSTDKIIFNAQGTQPCNVNRFDINICRPDSQPTRSKSIRVQAAGMASSQIDTTSSPAPGC